MSYNTSKHSAELIRNGSPSKGEKQKKCTTSTCAKDSTQGSDSEPSKEDDQQTPQAGTPLKEDQQKSSTGSTTGQLDFNMTPPMVDLQAGQTLEEAPTPTISEKDRIQIDMVLTTTQEQEEQEQKVHQKMVEEDKEEKLHYLYLTIDDGEVMDLEMFRSI